MKNLAKSVRENCDPSRSLLSSRHSQIIISLLLIALIFVARLTPHAANFTPVAAVGIFAGVYLRGKFAPLLPLIGLFASDIFIGGYGVRGMTIVYGTFLLTFFAGRLISRGKFANSKLPIKFAKIFSGALISSILFFLITNNIFLYTPSFYPMNFAGMIESYVAGIPFWRMQILGDLIYSGALLGAYEFAKTWLAHREKIREIKLAKNHI